MNSKPSLTPNALVTATHSIQLGRRVYEWSRFPPSENCHIQFLSYTGSAVIPAAYGGQFHVRQLLKILLNIYLKSFRKHISKSPEPLFSNFTEDIASLQAR